METPYDGGTKVCSNVPGHMTKTPYDKSAKIFTKYFGHMTKMAATPIYGKKPFKNLLSRTRRPVTLRLGM